MEFQTYSVEKRKQRMLTNQKMIVTVKAINYEICLPKKSTQMTWPVVFATLMKSLTVEEFSKPLDLQSVEEVEYDVEVGIQNQKRGVKKSCRNLTLTCSK